MLKAVPIARRPIYLREILIADKSFRKILFVLSLLLLPTVLRAQQMPRSRISTMPSQFIFLEFPIVLETMVGRSTIGAIGAFRPGILKGGEIPGYGPYHLQNYWNFAYSSITAGILYKYYLHDRYGFHLETSLLYRQWGFDRKYISYLGDHPFQGLRSEDQEIIILKLVIGKTITWKREHRPAILLEYFAGPSVRFKHIDLRTHEGIVDHVVVQDLREQGRSWSPALQLGIRCGIGM